MNSPLLIVVSGPSGVGKDAVLAHLKETGAPYHFTVTATTRTKRPNETDGVDYMFLSAETFKSMVGNEELLEWAVVHGNYYGVPKSQVTEALHRGQDVILKIDVQGAATIKSIVTDALFVFIAPPSLNELASRLQDRMTESEDALSLRLDNAKREMSASEYFEFVVVNETGKVEEAAIKIQELIEKERERIPPRRVSL